MKESQVSPAEGRNLVDHWGHWGYVTFIIPGLVNVYIAMENNHKFNG